MKKLSNKLIKLRNVTVPTNVSQRLSTFSREYFAVPQRANGPYDMGHIIWAIGYGPYHMEHLIIVFHM